MSNKPFNPLQESDKEQLNKPNMKSRKMYRVELTRSNSLSQDIAIMACLSNGSGKYISLTDMESVIKVDLIRFPVTNEDVSVTVTNNVLTIDRGTENLLAITEVEIMELVDEECVTLTRYSQGTITDNEAKELLN